MFDPNDEDEYAALANLLANASLPDDPDGGVDSSWKKIESFETIVAIDDVDLELLSTARKEVQVVADRLMRKMFGQRQRKKNKVTPGQILKVFLSTTFLATVRSQINQHIGSPLVADELATFIRIELLLSFYGTTPTAFFHYDNRELYPIASTIMRHERYAAILKALSTSEHQYVDKRTGSWNPPMQHERTLAKLMDLVRSLCSEIGYVKGQSILSMDDDLLRLRSISVQNIGLAHTNNPAKGLGVVHHGIVSAATDLYLGGHISSRGETTEDCVKILLRSLCGASSESQTDVPNIVAYDRGYGGPGGSIHDSVISYGCDTLGTAQRNRSFPLTFGQTPVEGQFNIAEAGSQAVYWVARRPTSFAANTDKRQYGMAWRTGLGRVVLGQTTSPMAKPGRYSIVTKERLAGANSLHIDLNDVQLKWYTALDFESKVTLLTESQRTPSWFLQRFGRITGTVSGTVFRALGCLRNLPLQQRTPTNQSILFVMTLIGVRVAGATAQDDDEEDALDRQYTAPELSAMTNAALQDICKAKGIAKGGNKAEITQRLLLYMSGTNARIQNIPALILNCWFMAPTNRSQSMKLGTLNESQILRNFPKFLDSLPEVHIHIEFVREYGLVANKEQPEASFSPDAICSILDTKRGSRYLAGCEFKTRTTVNTVTAEMLLAAKFGKYQQINISAPDIMSDDDSDNELLDLYGPDQDAMFKLEVASFKQSILESSYRAQIHK
jgi:hypothetical protein